MTSTSILFGTRLRVGASQVVHYSRRDEEAGLVPACGASGRSIVETGAPVSCVRCVARGDRKVALVDMAQREYINHISGDARMTSTPTPVTRCVCGYNLDVMPCPYHGRDRIAPAPIICGRCGFAGHPSWRCHASPVNYAVGHNMAGYLPESDVFVTDDFEHAKACLVADLLSAADDVMFEADDEDHAVELEAELCALADEVGAWFQPETVYSEFRSGNMAWWIVATDEPTTDELEMERDLDAAERAVNGPGASGVLYRFGGES